MAKEIRLKFSDSEARRLMWFLSKRYDMLNDKRATLNSLVGRALAEVVKDEAKETLRETLREIDTL